MSTNMRPEMMYGTFGHPLYQLNDSVQRLQEEHVLLEEGLSELYRMAKSIGANPQTINWSGALHYLGVMAAAFRRDMEAHVKWEAEKMFPMIAWYVGEELDHFTLMEQEYELADQYIEAFLEAVRQIHDRSICRKEATDMASYLLEAHSILKLHLRKEEDLIFALSDRSNEYGY